MGKSPSNPSPATLQSSTGTPPPGPPQTDVFAPGPTYQGYAHQPFDENRGTYASFLPKDPTASASGLDQSMLNAIMGISEHGPGYVGKGDTTTPAPTNVAAGAMSIPELHAPAEGSMRGWFQKAAQGLADSTNKFTSDPAHSGQSLEAYLQGREQLAKLMQLGAFRRPGESPQRGSGPGYGSSGPGGVGMGAGRTA